MQIGNYKLVSPVVAAPMAGVTDKPYRHVCRQYGAGLVVSEMITSQAGLRHTQKTQFRSDFSGEPEPISVQIVGTDPTQLAEAAQHNVDLGAQIIDINMGCPAKKVCKKAAGSALLGDEPLVQRILQSVVNAVDVPVTVKIRTGLTPDSKNATTVAQIAEQAGVAAITIHGRTRECKFNGQAEYETIKNVVDAISIPVIANGDICTPQQALNVLKFTGADAIMVGRAAQGQPWLFQAITNALTGKDYTPPAESERFETIVNHIQDIHSFYGSGLGVRLARKHIKWYLSMWEKPVPEEQRMTLSTTEDAAEQLSLLTTLLSRSMHRFAA